MPAQHIKPNPIPTRPDPFPFPFFFPQHPHTTPETQKNRKIPRNRANNPRSSPFHLPLRVNKTQRQRPIPCQAGLRNVAVILAGTRWPCEVWLKVNLKFFEFKKGLILLLYKYPFSSSERGLEIFIEKFEKAELGRHFFFRKFGRKLRLNLWLKLLLAF